MNELSLLLANLSFIGDSFYVLRHSEVYRIGLACGKLREANIKGVARGNWIKGGIAGCVVALHYQRRRYLNTREEY